MGITHLIIQLDFFNQWVDDVFTIEERELWQGFLNNHLMLLYLKKSDLETNLKGNIL